MKKTNLFRLPKEHPARRRSGLVTGGIGAAILLLMTGIASAQSASTGLVEGVVNLPATAPQTIQDGYVLHESVDLGGHYTGLNGSGRMYDTLVNIQSGPRVLGETFTLQAVPGSKHPLLDTLSAFTNGFGGDPYNFASLNFSKGKIYEFNGTFNRDRDYFNYDLLGNPNIPSGQSIAAVNGGISVPWRQVDSSPVMFNAVRRRTNTNLTIFPLSKVTFRAAYAQSILQGPSLSPGEAVGGADALLDQYERYSTDDFIGAVDWKPVPRTKFTYEEEVDHYKDGTYYTLDPQQFIAQEADGTPVEIGNWDSKAAPVVGCNGSTAATFTASPTGGLPVINPECNVATSYLRSEPTRMIFPSEIFRFQTTSIKNIAMNGDFRYTSANLNLPNYYENFKGLDGTTTSQTFTGSASGHRRVIALDYGITWQATKTLSFFDQLTYSNVHQPGTSVQSEVSEEIPVADTNSIANTALSTPVANAASAEGASSKGVPLPDYFGVKFLTNNATASWNASPRATFTLTYRYHMEEYGEGLPNNAPLAAGADTDGTVTIHENGGIFNAALRPTNRWNINGTVEVLSADNAITPVQPRQTQIYRIHTLYRPTSWATFSGAYIDTEHHNNTDNTSSLFPAADYAGPINHVDHDRSGSISADLAPSQYYGFDLTYAYTDVYTATNICYEPGNSSTIPGAATVSGIPCPDTGPLHGGTWEYGPVRDFMDAPTQSFSGSVTITPVSTFQANVGYNISAVSGNQFFNDAQEVNGSLQSAYQSPFVNIAWTYHSDWIWKINDSYYEYGEGGPSGAPLCSNTPLSASSTNPGSPEPGVSCLSPTVVGQTGLTEPSSGETSPRNFHANVLTVSMHYQF